MTPDEITDAISRIQHYLDTAAELMLELHTHKAHETLGITEAQLAWRIFGRPELKPNSAYKRFYRAWRTAEMQAQISDLIAQDSDGHMSYLDPATLSGMACEALHKVEQAARLEVLKAAYRDNGGTITVKAITEAAEAVAEYGVFAVLPDGEGGQVKASEAIGDLLYMQARNERRMDDKVRWPISRAIAVLDRPKGQEGVTIYFDNPPGLIRDLLNRRVVISIGIQDD